MIFYKVVIKNKVTDKAIGLSYDLNPLVFLYQDLKVLLKDSIKLLDVSSLKSLTTICSESLNVFFTGSIYEGKPSVTIDLGVPKVLERLNRENAHSASRDLFRFQDVINLVSEYIQYGFKVFIKLLNPLRNCYMRYFNTHVI